MDNKYVINIGRQLGSGGHEIGDKLSVKLGIDLYDNELISMASEKSGLCKEFFERADEEASQGVFGTLSNLHFAFMENATPSGSMLSNNSLFKIQSDVIQMLANIKSCIFMGRCADYILRDDPRAINIFICADTKDRIARVCAKRGIEEKAAVATIEKCDKRRSEYYNYYSAKTWGAAASYDLCINSSVFGIDETVEFLYEFVCQKLGITKK
jgi:cytidylate kinase